MINCEKHGLFTQAAYIHLQCSTACPDCVAESTASLGEQEVADFILSQKKDLIIERNTRSVIGPSEIDIWMPEIKTGVEYHGNWFHREEKSGRKKHCNKADKADAIGIRLLQIYESEWNNKKEIVKSRLSNLFGCSKQIMARKTKVRGVSAADKAIFLSKNHIQGNTSSSIAYGLEDEGRIVALMTFGKPRFNQKYDWELLRYCSVLGFSVVGGASRLLSHFTKNHSGSIISYADRRWSKGNLYHKLGFKLDVKIPSRYDYYNLNTKTMHHRMKFQKQNLVSMFGYSENISEYEIMKMNGYDRIWDAGQYRFILVKENLITDLTL